jgi:hypothetical protein
MTAVAANSFVNNARGEAIRYAEGHRPTLMPHEGAPMPSSSSDRNLVFGLLAPARGTPG